MPLLATEAGTRESPYRAAERTDDLRWWLLEEADMHERVWAVTRRMLRHARGRELRNFAYSLMYNDIDPHLLYRSSETLGTAAPGAGAIRLNILQNAVDTASSLIAKNQPKPLFLTDGAEYEYFAKAQDLTRYVGGGFDDCDFATAAVRAFTLGAVFGLGGVRFWGDEDEGRVRCEAVSPLEIIVDELDGYNERPRQLHLRRLYSRDVLAEMFPGAREAIMSAPADERTGALAQTVGDMIPVIESWHLRSGPKAKDGLHSITLQTATLLLEEYKRDDYPILFWRWYPMTTGFWGRGIAQELEPIQRAVNRTLRAIDEAHDLCGSPLWMVNRAAMIEWDQLLCNEIGRAVEYSGEAAPAPVAPPILSPEVYQHLWNLVQRAYEIVGISQGMAQGQKPAGVESAAAVREVADIASGRFQEVGQRWERFWVAAADLYVDLSKELYTKNKRLAVQAKEDDVLETIEWGDVDMDRDRFRIAVFPVSALPSTPAGRLATITELMQAGFMPKEQAMALLNMPDLKRFTNLETSTIDLVQKSIGRIKRKGVYSAAMKPIGQMNLNLAMQLATMEKVRAAFQELPTKTLNLLDQYLADINALMKAQAPPPAPPAPPGGPPPMPVGAPPPPMPAMPPAM